MFSISDWVKYSIIKTYLGVIGFDAPAILNKLKDYLADNPDKQNSRSKKEKCKNYGTCNFCLIVIV